MIMEIEMKVVSMETIKPSSPTPKPLRKHRLSCLDQSAPPMSIPLIYMLPSNPKIPNSDKSKRLKESLSAVLSRFYPLAGTLVGNHYVDCNDTGALFFEAEANCHLSQVIRNHKVLEKFLPFKAEESHAFCLAVQTTYFRCGGVALGILVSHKIADGLSTFMFGNAWAAASANGGDCGGSPMPKFDAAAYFPPLQDTSGIHPAGCLWKDDAVVARTFTFPAATISLLRERYSGGGGHRPSRVEAVSAFIWTQFQSATGKISTLTHNINVRNRVDPVMSENHFGNIVGLSMVTPAAEDGGVEVVRKIREAMKGVKSGYVASTDISAQLSNEMVVEFNVSSLCGFGLYEADFGWGRPVWVGFAQFPFKNIVYLLDAESGGGMEAHIQFTKQDMLKFQAYFKLPLITSSL